MNRLSFAAPLTCRFKLPVTMTVEKYFKGKSKSKSKRVTIFNDKASNSSLNFFQPNVQILFLICAVGLWLPFLATNLW